MVNEKDIMSVEYTELDNGLPALCFCSDLVIPITNKTMSQSFVNYFENDMKFKIANLRIQNLEFSLINNDITSVSAKVNSKFEFMGFVNTNDLHSCIAKVAKTLKELGEGSGE